MANARQYAKALEIASICQHSTESSRICQVSRALLTLHERGERLTQALVLVQRGFENGKLKDTTILMPEVSGQREMKLLSEIVTAALTQEENEK